MSEEVKQEGDFKMKKKPGRPKKLSKTEDNTTKVDFKKQEEEAIETKEKEIQDAVQESSAKTVDVDEQATDGKEVGEAHAEKQETTEEEKEVVIIEANDETETQLEKAEEEIKENPQPELPENIEKLVEFMQDTGGTLEDYVRLNTDYSKMGNESLIKEYYRSTKPHLDLEEIEWTMEENFEYDEEEADEREIRTKRLALKEEIAKAKSYFDETKKKYAANIEMRPAANSSEVEKAMEFFNRYNEEQNVRKDRFSKFQSGTKDYFKEHEGFEFNVGNKAFKYKINNTENVAEAQSDLNNLVKKFLNKKGEVSDLKGYHKAVYAARNPDSLANHFYEQGKADGLKEIMSKSANIESAKPNSGDITFNGFKVRAISGDDSSKLKIKKYKQ
tara:strand:- start:1019 stop:2182 length:1164 start_codon:yes stop_codon:yes gene_type:complete